MRSEVLTWKKLFFRWANQSRKSCENSSDLIRMAKIVKNLWFSLANEMRNDVRVKVSCVLSWRHSLCLDKHSQEWMRSLFHAWKCRKSFLFRIIKLLTNLLPNTRKLPRWKSVIKSLLLSVFASASSMQSFWRLRSRQAFFFNFL